MALKSGDKAPQFEALSTDGQVIRLTDYRGKKLVLYFYPMDDTPGCTAQACSLRDFNKEIAAKGPEDAARWGLDRPEVELTLFKDGAAELATLLVGRTDGAVTYVKLKAEPAIFAVSSKDVDDLRRARTDIPS